MDAAVGCARFHAHQAGRFERAEQPAHVARVEAETRSQRPHLVALGADLPKQPRLAQRPVAREESVVQRPDALGDGPVEAADLVHHRVVHCLILVRDRRLRVCGFASSVAARTSGPMERRGRRLLPARRRRAAPRASGRHRSQGERRREPGERRIPRPRRVTGCPPTLLPEG